jgi:hypothetical protein
MVPCRSCVNRCFGGTYHLHLRDRKIRERGTSVSGVPEERFQAEWLEWLEDPQIPQSSSECQPDDNPDSVTFLPYVGTIFNRISRVMSQHNIKSVGLPPKKACSFLRPVKDNLGLRTPSVYRTPGKVYIGQIGHSVDTRLKEHQRHICLFLPANYTTQQQRLYLGIIQAFKCHYRKQLIWNTAAMMLHRWSWMCCLQCSRNLETDNTHYNQELLCEVQFLDWKCQQQWWQCN